MTGGELVNWIQENNAEDMEVLYLQDDGIVTKIFNPEIAENAEIKKEYWEAQFLPDEGRSVIL